MADQRKIVVTSALPYANGDIHIGHLVEYLQTDFWVRYQKMRGHECRYFCADDTHGTPVMIRARQEGITPEKLIEKSHSMHLKDFTDFNVNFDNYFSTHSEINREFCTILFKALEEKDHVAIRQVEQNYCDHDKMFLPDRFVKGTCPHCGAEDQYGDNCDKCSATYSSFELISPYCVICGNKPAARSTDHIFFRLNDFKPFLSDWLPDHTQKEVSNKLMEWFGEDLRDWDISRDAPYFGFEIPGHPDKYFYVWLDAPVGYMASAKDWCIRNNTTFDELWNSDESEIYHFIGKDIVRFHCLFWPSIIMNAGYKTPNQIFVHGFLTVNGEKMSKTKGTFITARTYLNHLDPMYLRFYYACKLNSSTEDIDLSFTDFINRVNSDLFGKITNLGSRGAQMLKKRLDGRIGKMDTAGAALAEDARNKAELIGKHFEDRNFGRGIVEIRDLADRANRYFDEATPWKTIKSDPESARSVLSSILNVFRTLTIYLKPILPDYAERVEKLFGEEEYTWDDAKTVIEDHPIGDYEYLARQISEKEIDKIMNETKEEQQAEDSNQEEENGVISIDDFSRVDLRVAEIKEASEVEGADKLLKLQLDLGGETRQVFAGIKQAYTPEQLTGRKVLMVANLKPRKMKFGLSEGMVLAAGTGGKDLYLLSPDEGAETGQKVK